MNKPLSNFAGFLQIAYVTTDLTQALEIFRRDHGMAHWAELRDLPVETQPGRHSRLNIGLAFVGDVQIELIEPLGGDDAVYRAPLPASGFALKHHHFAQLFETEAEFEAQREAAKRRGEALALDGQSPGHARYFYTDHRATLGHYIEHIWYTPQGRAGMAQLPRN